LWWAVENHAISAMDRVRDTFASATAWQQPMTRAVILPRLMQRYAAEGTSRSFSACARLLEAAQSDGDRTKMLVALDQGLPTRITHPPGQMPDELLKQLRALRQEDSTGPPLPRATPLILVLARLNDEPARKEALALAADAHSQTELRISMLQLLGELGE